LRDLLRYNLTITQVASGPSPSPFLNGW
jgi:hypothetical protein